MQNMIYGKATVEMVADKRDVGNRTITEENALGLTGLVWIKMTVNSWNAFRGGFEYDEAGISSWVPAENVRNFQRVS